MTATHRVYLRAILAAALALGATAPTPAAADDLQGQTRQDFIDKLSPTTRGLTVATEEQQPQMDMRIQFEFGSAGLTDSARRVLDELGAALQSPELSAYRFSLVGHTDAVGSEAYNLKLSQARARAVRDYLVGNYQVSPERLRASGVGESDPADPADPESALNRRVVITNLGS
jgi:outer membrane protein OmpA-like peptidoglycan-associated protein